MSVIKLIGSNPNQVSRNRDLGDMAFQDAENIAGDVGVGGALTLDSGTANGVTYLNGSKVLTSGSALTFDGTNLGITGSNARINWSSMGTGGGLFMDYSTGATDFSITLGAASVVGYNTPSGWAHTWAVSGSEQMRLTSTGLGIGTSSPFAKLEVNGTIRSGTGSGESLSVGSVDVGKDIGLADGQGIVTGSARVMTFKTSGNVGIGTSSPEAFAGTTNVVVGGGSGNPAFTLYGGASTYSAVYFADGASGSDRYRGFFEYNHSTDSLAIGTGASTKATIDSTGHLIVPAGITLGTTAGTYNAANTLDDYEEGTWTPDTSYATFVGTPSSEGTYTKIGRMVVVRGSVTGGTSVAVGATGILAGALPFTSALNSTGIMVASTNTESGGIRATGTFLVATNNMSATASITFTATYFV